MIGARLPRHDPPELREGEIERIRPQPIFVRIDLDRAEPARVAKEQRAAVGERDAEPVPSRIVAVARVQQRITGRHAVHDHATAHPEVQAEHHARIDIEEQLLTTTARRDEPALAEDALRHARTQSPLEEPGVRCVHRADLAIECALAEEHARRLHLQDLGQRSVPVVRRS